MPKYLVRSEETVVTTRVRHHYIEADNASDAERVVRGGAGWTVNPAWEDTSTTERTDYTATECSDAGQAFVKAAFF